MTVSFLEYRSNSYCNKCFEERAAINQSGNRQYDTFEFMGEKIFVGTDADKDSSIRETQNRNWLSWEVIGNIYVMCH